MEDSSSSLQGPLNSHPPTSDLANDPTITRRNTASSTTLSDQTLTCRICRSEGTPEEPLFYPCKCSGSIKYVHQECLMEWLSHSHKKHCELCKTPFRFTKLYDANMPPKLPWAVFIRRACVHLVQMFGRGCRGLLVSVVWLVILPWMIRWAWRWMFWVADAGWARESFVHKFKKASLESDLRGSISQVNETAYSMSGFEDQLGRMWNFTFNANASTAGPAAYRLASDFFAKTLSAVNSLTNGTSTSGSVTTTQESWPQADSSILSSWTYISQITPNPHLNRIILDIFEGQLITCVVITGFILVFLIREWVVQQQPLVNLENLGHVQQQLREAAERVQADNERLRRQQELLIQARQRLLELQNETHTARETMDAEIEAEKAEYVGWEGLETIIDHATNHLRNKDEGERERFKYCARAVTAQIRAASRSGERIDEVTEKLSEKLATFSSDEREAWEAILLAEIERIGTVSHPHAQPASGDVDANPEEDAGEGLDHGEETANIRRPPMPDRDFSSRATQIQRLLEEAEGIFASSHDTPRTSGTEIASETPSLVSAPSPSGSWQQVTPPTEQAADDGLQEEEKLSEMPITNAGPDAKVNIKRSGKGKARAVPAPKEVTALELKKRQEEDEAMKKLEMEIQAEDAAANTTAAEQTDPPLNNPFHPDGPLPERRPSETLGNRVASVFREEFGLDEAGLEDIRQGGVDVDDEAVPDNEQPEEQPQPRPAPAPPTYFQRLSDLFWGDIQPQSALEPAQVPQEERADGEHDGQEAPFVPVANGQPAFAALPDHVHAEPDPEVLAAAQQLGLDAEAVEEAEDLEGIFELIGLQGPLIGLLQTSTFCTVLVTGTVFGAVGLPYVWGKLVLSFTGSPMYFLVQLPLEVASFVADFVVDLTLLFGGWSVFVLTLAAEFLFTALAAWLPALEHVDMEKWTQWVYNFATATASASGTRLQSWFLTTGTSEVDVMDSSWAFLAASVHAHASLRTIQEEAGAVIQWTGDVITAVVETVSSGKVTQSLYAGLAQLPSVMPKLAESLTFLWEYTQPLLRPLGILKTGSLTFDTPSAPLDPSLVYWSSNDRFLAVLAGYISLAALAAVYVALDTPITRSEAGRKSEKVVRDTLKQAGGVLKVILIISIEMLVFPLYCGLLLDIAFLPLFRGESVATRWAFATGRPYLFCFVHWFVGTCYMFHFALFVGMCRKILRKGVLWFIRDPDDPTFHPVRDVLERNVTTQLRKIAFSALVYGALVILCLGGVIWTIGRVFEGIFPIYWVNTEPVLEFPVDLLLYNAVTPLLIRLFKPSDAVNALYAWWLRWCARVLRLSHFLFDDRRQDEEGHYVRKSWSSFLLMRTTGMPMDVFSEDRGSIEVAEESDVSFQRDGKYVLTPCNDQYRPPKAGEAFLYTDEDDVYIADKDGKKNDHFAKVYVPPFFRLRVTLFMVCLWMFSAFSGLCATLVPLCFGRQIFAIFLPQGLRVNDIYAYTVGAYILGGLLYAMLQGRSSLQYLREKAPSVDLKAWTTPAKKYALRALKCLYVYGFVCLVLPAIFALVLQFYLIVPLQTYAASLAESIAADEQTSSAAANVTQATGAMITESLGLKVKELPVLAQHTIHILQDYCLGLIYVRLATRFVLTAPTSRAAEAFRRIVADGYLNPNVRLATRFLVAPVVLLAAFVLLLPPAMTKIGMGSGWLYYLFSDSASPLDEEMQTKLYRYSYPFAAGLVVVLLGVSEVAGATSRWRARIRDEVYLVGERLHNFGEKKPPAGSRSVVRKER